MSSLKQIAANRRNALKSTGPTTQEGKERSRCNAIRHGLTSETVIAPLEDAEDYQAFEEAIIADYDAETAVERELVLRLASVLWRLRRASGIESALFETVAIEPDIKGPYSRPSLIAGVDLTEQDQPFLQVARKPEALVASERNLDSKKEIGDSFLRLAALPISPLDRLSRYEYVLWRQARQIVFTIESLRRRERHSRFPFSFHRSGR
jgi:hypothetical protein